VSLHGRRFGKHSPASEEYGVERKGEIHFMSNVVLKKNNQQQQLTHLRKMMDNTLLIPDMFADQEPEHVSCLYDTSSK
jgi:hypothetical protein